MIVYSKRDIPGPCSYDNPAIGKPGGVRSVLCAVFTRCPRAIRAPRAVTTVPG